MFESQNLEVEPERPDYWWHRLIVGVIEYEVAVWLRDAWFGLHFTYDRADAVAFQRLAEYGWGLPAAVRVVP